MLRVAMVTLAVLLLLMGTLGLGGVSSPWIRFFDVGFALAAALVAFQLHRRETEIIRTGTPTIFAGGLLLLWLVAWITGAPAWQTWGNFGVGCVFALLAFSERWQAREEDMPANVIRMRRRA